MVPRISKNKTCHTGREIFTTVGNRVFQHYQLNPEVQIFLILADDVLPFPTQCMDSSNHRSIPEVLDDAENELPDLYRPTLNLLCGWLITIKDDIEMLNE
jgi:hypothetical protein